MPSENDTNKRGKKGETTRVFDRLRRLGEELCRTDDSKRGRKKNFAVAQGITKDLFGGTPVSTVAATLCGNATNEHTKLSPNATQQKKKNFGGPTPHGDHSQKLRDRKKNKKR
jgi:hypothetical protein